VHDPVVSAAAAPGARGCATAIDCVRGADVVILTTAWPEYRDLSLDTLSQHMRGRVLIDPYRLLDGAKAGSLGFAYHTLGRRAVGPA
jgi:UDPglucose 6-dehydrogenase